MKFTKLGKALLVSALSAGVILGVASCVQSYTVGFLYVTGTVTAQPSGNGIISGFKIDHNTGVLKPINGLPISSGGANPVRATLLTGSRFLYVLNQGANSSGGSTCTTTDPCVNANVAQFAVGGNGILTSQETFTPHGYNPFRILSDSSGNYLFVLDHDSPDNYTSYNPKTNGCTLALGAGVAKCGAIEVYQINQTTGRLQLVVNAQVSLEGGAALSYFPVPVNPIDFTQTSGYILSLSGTTTTGDFAFPYTYNANNGQLTVNQSSPQPLNIHAATAIVGTSGYVYVLDNEPITVGGTEASDSQILPYSLGNNGSLQAQTGGSVPDDPTQANPIYLLVESKGKWAYVANTGNNDTTTGDAQSGITGYIIDPATHQLTEMPGLPFGTGAGPECLVEDPSDQFIYTANHFDSTVTGKAIDENAGVLNDLPKASSFSLTGPATWCLINGRTN
jgi:6-phosphogluconolactonase (cycloisomerase 2 family)